MSSALAREIASRINHRPVYLDRDHCDIIGHLREIATTNVIEVRAAFASRRLDMLAAYGFEPPEQRKPFAFAGGAAIIPITGMLVNRINWSSASATGYDFIRGQLRCALADPDVSQIVFDVDSNGGLVSGCQELAAEIFASRDVKPSTAVVDARGYSAAYYLASAASRVVCTPSGGVGSIGVAAVHVDLSAALENFGIKVTLIHKGDEKVDGNPYAALSDRARASIEKDIGYHYDSFVEAVARHRDMSESDVRATEAGCFSAKEAHDRGLIDDIHTPTEALTGLNEGSSQMELTAEQIRDIATTAAREAAREAVEADRARSSAIRTAPEAKGREKLAEHLASNTSMSVDEAKAILAQSPTQAEEPATRRPAPNAFAAAMDQSINPNIGPDNGSETRAEGDDSEARVSRVLGNYQATTGRKVLPMRGAA